MSTASIGAALLSVLFTPAIALAQPPATSFADLARIVERGDTVTVVDDAQARTRGVVFAIAAEVVLRADGVNRRWSAAGISEVRRRQPDSLWNGALIGAAIGGGLSSLNYLDNECRGDPACAQAVAIYGAIGAGVGALVDSLIRGDRSIYIRPSTSGWQAGVEVRWR
jgi:hypothetical protein